MATGSIDLQRGPQIKPQDKRLGRRTMEEHSGPHGKRMTTGRSGRPQPRPQPRSFQEGKRPCNTRQEKVSESAAATQRGTTLRRQGLPRGKYPQEHRLPFYLFIPSLFFSSPFLPQSPSSSSPPSLSSPSSPGQRP